jgi:hypothetical protein
MGIRRLGAELCFKDIAATGHIFSPRTPLLCPLAATMCKLRMLHFRVNFASYILCGKLHNIHALVIGSQFG